MVTVGVDPGKQNFAVVALDDRGVAFFAHMLQHTIKSMSMHCAEQRVLYRRAIRGVLRRLRPGELIVESYNMRGFGSVNNELINLMIGGLMSECDHLGITEHATMASSWKLEVGRYYAATDYVPHADAKKRAKLAMNHLYQYADRLRLPAHPVDALLLATYLQHSKSMATVSFDRVRQNIARLARLLPKSVLRRKGKRDAVPPRKKTSGRSVRALPVLALERGRGQLVPGGAVRNRVAHRGRHQQRDGRQPGVGEREGRSRKAAPKAVGSASVSRVRGERVREMRQGEVLAREVRRGRRGDREVRQPRASRSRPAHGRP